MASISTRAPLGSDGDTGTGRGIGSEGFAVHTVHSLKISHIHDEYGHFGHIRGRGSGFGEDGLHVGKGLRGLFLHIIGNEFTRGRNHTDLAGEIQGAAFTDSLRVGADGGGGWRSWS